MWERLFHTDWRSNVDVNIGPVTSGTVQSISERVYYGDYKISALNEAGGVIDEATVTMTKSSGSASVSLSV